ncbi:uncharacterized protein LOC103695806 [Phoenix dactylifera]|uniref:Uncharacterized protein LOC103695806 n=1 Tax=Phoenix dactylifera TaxID=42345 RepID=A0A8B7BFD7_PHODC|nr:uncharacterized protein LOC103695806 [Phoenix dactylifera]
MKENGIKYTALMFFFAVAIEIGGISAQSSLTCRNRPSPCFRKQVGCPKECPVAKPSDPKAKGCFLDCNSPKCETVCRGRKANCNGLGSGCYDPRFIGGDGIVFYFHGRRDEYFSLISDPNLQINARFIGTRPAGRTRDFTWIQALSIMFSSHAFTVEATRTERWDDAVDHLHFTYNGEPLEVPEGHLSEWKTIDKKLAVERTGSRNSIMITVEGIAEVSLNVVPVTKEDDRIHNYHIPSDDCFAHLEVQLRIFGLSPNVEGVLGRTYRPNFNNTAKPGVAMSVVGGEDKYRTSSLLSPDCKLCLFSPVTVN